MRKYTGVICALFAAAVTAELGVDKPSRYNDPSSPCKKPSGKKIEGFQRKPLEHVFVPDDFDWGNVNGVNYLTNMRN